MNFLNFFRMNLLEETYFGRILPVEKPNEADLEISFVDDQNSTVMSGAEICKILLHLYDICDLNGGKPSELSKKKPLVISALSGLLCVSNQAKKQGLQSGLLEVCTLSFYFKHCNLLFYLLAQRKTTTS